MAFHKVLVPLADGVEESEAVICIDTLRRAGWDVVTAGIREGVVRASRGVKLVPDIAWEEVDPGQYEVIVIPGGGGGTKHLAEDRRVLDAIRTMHEDGKWITAVCAGPVVLQAAGVLEGKRITSHPSAADKLKHVERVDQPVVVDDHMITSQGPGTSFAFALTIIAQVENEETADQIARAMVVS